MSISASKNNYFLEIKSGNDKTKVRYLNYYYGVPQSVSKTNRPAYESAGGYAGSDISFGLTYKVNAWWFASFARYYNLSGAVYDESPLVRQTSQWSLGFGFAWIFYSSKWSHKK